MASAKRSSNLTVQSTSSRRPMLGPGHPSDRCPDSLPRAPSRPSSRVHVPGSSTVRGCPAGTDGLDGELARLQDRGTGGMAPFATPRASAGPTALRPSGRSLGSDAVGRRRGPAGPKSGRPTAESASGSVKVLSQLWTVDAPRSGQRSRRAPRALEDVERVLTAPARTRLGHGKGVLSRLMLYMGFV